MAFTFTPLMQRFCDGGSVVLDVYTTGGVDGPLRGAVLASTCGLLGLLLGALLLLYLVCMLGYGAVAAGWIAGCVWLPLTVALCLSKKVRCVGILFVISCLMKKSRNLLLTAGIGFVMLGNIRNTLENLRALFAGMICNLKAKSLSASFAPLSNYIAMLKWVGKLIGSIDFGLAELDTDISISADANAEAFLAKLVEAGRHINETINDTLSVVHTLSSVKRKMFPVVSFLLLLTFIALHIKKYRNQVKYKNKFICRRFVAFDAEEKAAGRPHVLPLTPREEKRYISIPSLRLTRAEGRAMLKFGIPVLSHFVSWVIFLTVDGLTYFFVEVITGHLATLEPFDVPLIMKLTGKQTFIGIQIGDEYYRTKDVSFKVTLFEKRCLPKPKLLVYDSVVPVVFLLSVLLAMAVMAAKLAQLRLLVCERFFSRCAEDRVRHLHAEILRKRRKARTSADGGALGSFLLKPCFWFPLLFRPSQNELNKDSVSAGLAHRK